MRVGPYEILDEVARGGVGVLYRARDPRSGRTVALKLLLIEGEATQRRFAREARAMAQLRHPGVARCYEAGEHQGQPYLAMEFVEGHSLQDRLNREGRLPVHEVRRIGVALCDALEAVHAAGLLHRDLKPANVLQNVAGRIVLTDFGLVKQDDAGRPQTLSLSVLGGLLGTPGYWPPEQARGQLAAIGPHSDVYALGATLYALLCGQPPRAGADLLETLELLEQPVTPLRELHPGIPPELDAGVLRALELDPAARPDLGELRAVLTGAASPPPPPPRSRLQLALALGLATVGVAALGWAAWSRSAPAARPGAPPAQRVDPPPAAPTPNPPPPTRGTPVRVLSAPGSHVLAVSAVAISPDGESVFSATLGGELRLWASDSGALLETWLPEVGGFAAVAWGPSMLLAASRDGTLVRIAGGEADMRPLGHPTCHDLDSDPAGWVVSAGSDGLRLWTAEQIRGRGPPPQRAIEAPVDVARFAPGGGGLALGESRCWRWGTDGAVEATALPGSRYSDLAWSPDGTLVALLERAHRVSLYRWPELELLQQGQVHKPRDGEPREIGSSSLCFDARGERLYTVGVYPQVRAWQVPSLEAAAGGFYVPWRSRSARIRRAGNAVIAGGSSGQLLAFSTASGLPTWRRAPRPLAVSTRSGDLGPVVGGMTWFGPRILLSTDEGLQLVDVNTGLRLGQPQTPLSGLARLASHGDYVLGIKDGVTLLARARVVGEHLLVDEPNYLQPERGHTVVDQREIREQLFLLYRGADGRAVVHVRDLRTGMRVGQIGPLDLGAGRLHLGDTLSQGHRVWAAGPTQLLMLEVDREPSSMELSTPLAYVAEVGAGETLLVGVDGAWQLGENASGTILAQGHWTEPAAVEAIAPRRVVLKSERTVRVFDLARATELASLALPPGDYPVGTLAAPAGDALYVWTCRGEVWRLPLPR